MNKRKFVEELSKYLNLSTETCYQIDEILEDNFFISKSNKDKIITILIKELNMDEEKAIEVYDTAKKIFNREIKYRLLHPFKDLDK